MNERDVSGENEHVRITTATIDRRVERLEHAQAETDRKVDNIALRMESFREINDLKLSALRTALDTNSAKLDAFMVKIEGLLQEGLRQAADMRSTPLGRSIDDRLVALEHTIDDHENTLDNYRGAGSLIRLFVFPVVSIVVSIIAVAIALSQQILLPNVK